MTAKQEILHNLSQHGAMTRKELAEKSSKSFIAVAKAVDSLLSEGLLTSVGYKTDRRHSQLVDLDCSYKFALGIGIFGGIVSLGLTTVRGEMLGQDLFPQTEDFTDEIVAGISRLLRDNALEPRKIIGVGLCASSDMDKGLVALIEGEAGKNGLRLLFEPADDYVGYAEQYLPLPKERIFLLGCGKVIRDIYLANEK